MKSSTKGYRSSLIAKLWRDTRSRIGLIILCLALLISVLGAYIRPDDSKNANQQHLVLAKKKPGFKAKILQIKTNKIESDNFFGSGLFFGGVDNDIQEIPIEFYSIEDDYLVYIPLKEDFEKKMLLADVLYAIDVDSYDSTDNGLVFTDMNGREINTSISELVAASKEAIVERTYFLGTDTFGRDLLSRLMGGVIFSLSVGFISVLISLVIGISLGAIAGFYRGWVDQVIMWFVNVIWSIPTLLMVIAITLVMGKGFVQVFIAVGLTMWVEVARVVRGQVISIREKDFIEATKALGYSEYRIISRHILPNIIGPVIVISAANFASAILIEAGLSFLGIGTQIPMPSWGMMIKEHYPFLTTDLAYLAFIPGLCIMILVLSFMLIGNRLRDVYDVKETS
ncbi:MAG: peptide/nickel transport system permease protein [Glaciecola sp.]|jgi:peptide/nickel transport system permease protein